MNQIKCIFFIGTLVSLILLSPSTILYANAQDEEHEDEPDVQHIQIDDESEVQHVHVHEDHEDHEEHDELVKIFLSVNTISFSKSIEVFLFQVEEEPFEFYLQNNNDMVHITGIELQLKDLTLQEKKKFSDSSSTIKGQDIEIKLFKGETNDVIPTPVELEPYEILRVELSSENITDQGTYAGELLVTGDNIEPSTVEVKLTINHNNYELLGFTLLGAVISLSIGFHLTGREKRKEWENSIDDDSAIISHINGYIRNLNHLRETITPEAWKKFRIVYNKKRNSIEKYRDKLALDNEAEAVKWFKDIANQLPQKYFDKPRDIDERRIKLVEIMDVNRIKENNPKDEFPSEELLEETKKIIELENTKKQRELKQGELNDDEKTHLQHHKKVVKKLIEQDRKNIKEIVVQINKEDIEYLEIKANKLSDEEKEHLNELSDEEKEHLNELSDEEKEHLNELSDEEKEHLNELKNELKKLERQELTSDKEIALLEARLKELIIEGEGLTLPTSDDDASIEEKIKKGYTCEEIANELDSILEKRPHRSIVNIMIGHKELRGDQDQVWKERTEFYEKLRNKMTKDERTKNLHDIGKISFFLTGLVASVPAGIFATANFVGQPYVDLLIALAIGFAFHRGKDIPKTITKITEKSSKVTRPTSKPKTANHQGHGGHN